MRKGHVAFDHRIVTNEGWATYPIVTFLDSPEIEVEVINRSDQPSKGVGERVTVPIAVERFLQALESPETLPASLSSATSEAAMPGS